MSSRTSASYEDRLIESVSNDLLASADTLATDQGPPPDMDSPSEREKVRLWWRQDPSLQDEQQRQVFRSMLRTTGVPQEALPTLILGQLHPKLLPLYAEPVATDGQADLLVGLAEWPFRLGLYDHLDPKERVKEAARLSRTQPPMPSQPVMPMTPDAGQPHPTAPAMSQEPGETPQ